jgi:hypothetical protein
MTVWLWLYVYVCMTMTVWLWLYDYDCMTENKLETSQQQEQEVEKWYLEPLLAVKKCFQDLSSFAVDRRQNMKQNLLGIWRSLPVTAIKYNPCSARKFGKKIFVVFLRSLLNPIAPCVSLLLVVGRVTE